jgi:iron(III) transport system substrate-binding protein
MKKWTLFCLLSVITFLIYSRPNSTTAISYGKDGIPDLKGHHLIAYVAAREEVGEALLSSFCQKRGCTYEYLRLSSEAVVKRVNEERHAPKADVVIGGTLNAHITMKSKDLSTPISIKHKGSLSKELFDSENYWFGYEIVQLAVTVNTERWQTIMKDQPIPPSFSLQDLTNERFRGEIVMSDPNFSGTAFSLFSFITQSMSKSEAHSYVKQLTENAEAVTVNGFFPAQMVGSGEYMLSINFLGDQRVLQEAGLPIKSIELEGAPISIAGLSKLMHAPNGQVADLFIQFCLSDEAAKIINQLSSGTPITNVSKQHFSAHSKSTFQQTVQETKELIEFWNDLRLLQY